MKTWFIYLIFTLSSCQRSHHIEFNKLQEKLSKHFSYTLFESEISPHKNCTRYIFNIRGKANSDLRITNYERTFILSPGELPAALNTVGLDRMREEHINNLKTRGIREHCLEVKDFECIKYHFRDPTEDDLFSLAQKLDDQYSISLKQGEIITNKLQMDLCPSKEIEISYLLHVP